MWILALIGVVILLIILTRPRKRSNRLADAEAYIRSGSGALYRHYSIKATQDILRGKIGCDGHIADLDDDQVVAIVQSIRTEKGMGPIAENNLPGYVDPDEFIDLSGM